MDCIFHGILQARILEWVAFPFSRESFQPRDRTQVFHIAGRFLTSEGTREALICKADLKGDHTEISGFGEEGKAVGGLMNYLIRKVAAEFDLEGWITLLLPWN